MNEKGRQTKLLAAIAILAMVVCAFAVAMPAGETDAAPVDVVAAPDNAVPVTTADAFGTAIENGTQNIEITKAISVKTGTYTLAENQSIWITGEGKLTMAGGTMTINGTIYNNVGTNDSNSGLVLTSGTVTFGSTGVLYSVCAVDAQASVDVTAYFTSTDTAVSGYSQYQHYYSGNIATLIPIATENSNYTGVSAGNWIVSYGDKSITGNVDLGDTGLYVMTGDVTIADGAVLAADAVNAGTYTSIVNNGIIIAHSYTVTSLINTYLAVTIPEGTEATYSNGTFTISGTALAADINNAKPEGLDWINVFGNSAAGYAYIQVDGLENIYGEIADPEYRIVQTNSALSIYEDKDEYVSFDETKKVWTKNKPYNTEGDIDQYAFLVPKTGNVVISVYNGESTSAVGTLTFNLSNTDTSSIVSSIEESALEAAFAQNDDVVYTGVQPTTAIDLGMMAGDQTFTMTNISGYASSSPLDITVGNTTITVSNLSADVIVFSVGSVVFYAENLSGDFTNVNDLELSGDLDGPVKLFVTDGNGLAYVNAGTTLNLGGNTLTINPGVVLTARGTITNGTIVVEKGATLDYSNIEGVTIQNKGGIVKINGSQGTENIISVSQSVNGTYYLTADTTILNGVTLTIPRNAVLDLMGYNLTVEGTLVIENRGVVTSSVDRIVNGQTVEGSITLATTGAIQNSGTIGDTMPITIKNGAVKSDGTTPATPNNETQYIQMQGVSGVSITLTRSGTGDARVYDMSVSGDVSTVSGVSVNKLTLNYVDISADLTIGRNVEFTANNTIVEDDVVFTNNGKIANLSGFTLSDGASAVINAPTTGAITVQTGEIESGDDFVDDISVPASVTFGNTDYITGITVSVGRVTLTDDNNDNHVYQRMYVSGSIDAVKKVSTSTEDPAGSITLAGTVYVDGTLTIPSDVTVTGGTFDLTPSGTVVVQDRGADELDLTYAGARYIVETTENNVDVETTYYTNFASAMGAIATAQDGIVYISGTFEISGTYTVGADQEIAVDGTVNVTVAEDGEITVDSQGVVADNAFGLIEGRVIVLEGLGYEPEEGVGIYAVVTVDEETYDTTYSGFKIALDNATSGQTITVVDKAEYDGNMTIPAGVTVTLSTDVELTVLGNVTVQEQGTLNVGDGATLAVGKDAKDYTITVAGTLDATEGGAITNANSAKVNLYSTGTTSVETANAITDVTVNAGSYTDEFVVYTTLAAAVAYAEENALEQVTAEGTFTESGAIDSDGVDIIVEGKVTLGSVTINDAEIRIGTAAPGEEVDYWYTADVSGAFGDGTSDATVSVYRTSTTVESVVEQDATGASTYTLNLYGVLGNTEISAGTVTFAGASINAYKDNTFTVASGATLVIPEDGEVTISGTADYLANNGTILIEGTLEVETAAEIGGTVDIAEDATLTVGGTLTVFGDVNVDENGQFNVNEILEVGENPELLAATTTGNIAGQVTLGPDAVVIVFAGASVAEAEMTDATNTELQSTAYSINGIQFATAYTLATDKAINGIDAYVTQMKDLDVPYIEDSENPGRYVSDIVWYSGETPVTDADIGEYPEVTAEIDYQGIYITVSVGSQITLSIDGVIVNDMEIGVGKYLQIGTHTVSATVNPGFTGDITITFNGQTVTNGQFEITSDMIGEEIVLSATGNITQDSTVVIDGGSSDDSGMGLTDYLLIILVVLIVIMAIIVALRLMRS